MKKIIIYSFIAVLAFILTACGGNTVVDDPNNNEPNNPSQNEQNDKQTNENSNHDQEPLTLEETADAIVSALSKRDMELLASYVHPEKGVRFTPYGYVDLENNLVFSKDEIAGLMDDPTTYTWGNFDGSGEPIEYTFAEYFDDFVYDADFAKADEVAIDERLGQGNTIDNTAEVYPDAKVVEYHFSGFEEEYAGIDWKSLRLVLELADSEWVLVGIIHDEWTI